MTLFVKFYTNSYQAKAQLTCPLSNLKFQWDSFLETYNHGFTIIHDFKPKRTSFI